VQVKASRGASAEAAAAFAARDVLAALYPAQAGAFDTLLANQLAGMPPGLVRQGEAIGHAVATAVLKWRQNDGWPATVASDPAYVLPPFPRLWQPTPPANVSFVALSTVSRRFAKRSKGLLRCRWARAAPHGDIVETEEQSIGK
jgi:hypothetical protein